MRKVLFASSEVYPLIKTGGLADVAGSLPVALHKQRQDVCVILPAYAEVKAKASNAKTMATLSLGDAEVYILQTELPGTSIKAWLVDYAPYFDRPGNPYMAENGEAWPDNAERFALFCRVIVEIAMARAGLDWKPDVIHCNDWQTGLVPALLSLETQAPATVFTIHNLAYQGIFPHSTYVSLDLPETLWSFHSLEFHGQLSFIKGGLVYADRITTVSPNYAKEIQTAEFGYGLEDLLEYRSQYLFGILNGIDTEDWNPEKDHYITNHYSIRNLAGKKLNKQAVLDRFELPAKSGGPLIGLVGRLVQQKGIDIILDSFVEIMKWPLQIVLLGSGDPKYEKALRAAQRKYPDKLGIHIGYDEGLAHLIEAGADMFLMPSRFEPCGLNQLYSLRYGTLPVVRNVGGLADTVVDANKANLAAGVANGFVFSGETGADLARTIARALKLYQKPSLWKKLQLIAMWRDSSWESSAEQYIELYNQID